MRDYDLRPETFGALVFDRRYFCFAAIGQEHFRLLGGGSRGHASGDCIATESAHDALLRGEYWTSEKRENRLPSLISPSCEMSSDLSAPCAVGVLVTSECNLRCVYCYARSAPVGELREDDVPVLVERLSNARVMACWVSGGEPTLWSHLHTLILSMTECGIPVAMDTNGCGPGRRVLATLKGIPDLFIRISLDSTDIAVHDKVRGQCRETLETIDKLAAIHTNVGIITVVHKLNSHTLVRMSRVLARLGVRRWTLLRLNEAHLDAGLKQCLQLSSSDFEISSASAVAEATTLGITTTVIRGNQPRSTLLIGPNSSYYTIGEGKEGPEVLGNLADFRIQDIWTSPGRIDRHTHLRKYLGMETDDFHKEAG